VTRKFVPPPKRVVIREIVLTLKYCQEDFASLPPPAPPLKDVDFKLRPIFSRRYRKLPLPQGYNQF